MTSTLSGDHLEDMDHLFGGIRFATWIFSSGEGVAKDRCFCGNTGNMWLYPTGEQPPQKACKLTILQLCPPS